MSTADVLVIGGGPAGLAAAIASRLKGLEVTVVDAAHPPIDKACGEAVLPSGVEALRRLGLRLSSDDAFLFRGIRFLGGGVSLEARFESGWGLAIRRTRLHQILAGRASELGVRLLWGTRVTHDDRLTSCRWVVGADGEHSRVRRTAGLDAVRQESLRFGFRRHYQISPWTDFVEVHWGSRCQIYVTPVSHEEVGVALLSRDPHLRLDGALAEFPELRSRLQCARESSTERGGVSASRRLRRVFRGHTALIGDASGSVDAITGDGLSLSFQQAIALSEALCSGDLASYEAAHSRLARRPTLVANVLLLLDRFPWLRRGVLRMLAFDPPIFGKLLARHALIVP
ncbi:MAG TPA: FAD-dependent monooxygenase [Bryobacteraceae bacterium]|nr:FAD-dependent monooxygenase [Bryobacteraceae bacterium]